MGAEPALSLPKGHALLAGVDEVGRGPLAGPVMAGAVILDPHLDAPWLARVRDSKTLTPRIRQELALLIQHHALAWSCGLATVAEIDELGIVGATRLAMSRAVAGLKVRPDRLLVDGRPIGDLGLPAQSLIHGDAINRSIAAASIVAKVLRDSLMVEMDARYPGYGFARHKGYGTPEHLARLHSLGPCGEHRRSFRPVWTALESAASSQRIDQLT